MDGVTVTTLKRIHHPKGDLFHAMKSSDIGFAGFGEAYFSSIKKGETKGWKKHKKMTLNIIVPIGGVELVIYDDENDQFFKIVLSNKNYKRLTIEPGKWVCFSGIEKFNLLLNIASCEHDPNESLNADLKKFNIK
jgi:dTDP-4-dehydrorhamnose 3,5-epimerase